MYATVLCIIFEPFVTVVFQLKVVENWEALNGCNELLITFFF